MLETPIVLIHGTNAGPWTMENFKTYFEQAGYSCSSPAYRHHGNAKTLQGADHLTGLSIADYAEDIAQHIDTLNIPPILIGHSLGGVIAQKLAARGLARAIVLLNGSVTWGTLPTTNQERELAKLLMSAGNFWESTLLPDFETMAKFGLNKLPLSEQKEVFERLGPESGRVLFELFFWMYDEHQTTKIDYAKVTCPVMFVSGSEDLAVPPSTARLIANHYGSNATFYEAQGFGHYLTLEPGWKEIAQKCVAWITKVST